MTGQDQATTPLAEGACDIRGAVAFTGMSRSRIYLGMQRGELRYYTSGSRRFFAKRDLTDWLKTILKPVGA